MTMHLQPSIGGLPIRDRGLLSSYPSRRKSHNYTCLSIYKQINKTFNFLVHIYVYMVYIHICLVMQW